MIHYEDQFNRISKLQNGWNGKNTVAPTKQTIDNAIAIIEHLRETFIIHNNIADIQAFPMDCGEITLEIDIK